MDCGWEDLGEKVVDISSKFVDNLLNLMSFSYNEEAIKLITEESLGRFQNLAKKLAEEIQNGYYCQYEDMENVISTIRNEFIAIATICRQTNSNECMKERTLRLSFWQVKMGRNFSF
ncbi:Uncharacterised protein [Dorea longicatena]|uniref:Uncharacterized protein n=2 Tax=Dorea longicatena TaxID=88431 RepID=A0A173TZ30_9FIRM|nr:Uncharacterised protein [Dorea longicatena]